MKTTKQKNISSVWERKSDDLSTLPVEVAQILQNLPQTNTAPIILFFTIKTGIIDNYIDNGYINNCSYNQDCDIN